MKLYIVKDGTEKAFVSKNGVRVFDTNYYSITYNFISNEGYIEKKAENYWRLYTQIGQKINQLRYHKCISLDGCIEKLIQLKGDDNITIIDQNQLINILSKEQ